jgi:hypothetical protein
MRNWIRRGWILLGIFSASFSNAGNRPASHRGVFVSDARHAFYEIVKIESDASDAEFLIPGTHPSKSPYFGIRPVSLSSRVSMPSGMNLYPLTLTANRDGFPESDPVKGVEYGPAGLVSEWNSDRREFSAKYTNGFKSRDLFKVKAPAFLGGIEDAITDQFGNVFWISETLGKGLRIHHQSARDSSIPLNELLMGEKLVKVRGNPSGDGILALLESGQVLDVRVPEDFSLRVSKVNSITEFRAVDLEVGPLAGNPHEFSLVLFGMDALRGKVGIWVKEGSAQAKAMKVKMSYVDPFKRIIEVPFITAIYSNTHFTELKHLLDRHPSELNRYLQYQYEVRQEEIELMVHRSNSKEGNPLDERNLIGRKAVIDPRNPGLCRWYLLSHFGLSPDLWVN